MWERGGWCGEDKKVRRKKGEVDVHAKLVTSWVILTELFNLFAYFLQLLYKLRCARIHTHTRMQTHTHTHTHTHQPHSSNGRIQIVMLQTATCPTLHRATLPGETPPDINHMGRKRTKLGTDSYQIYLGITFDKTLNGSFSSEEIHFITKVWPL